MSRTAEELMTHHIESMMKMKENSNLDEALADYSEDLVAITRLDGRTRTMGYDTLTDTMRNTFTFATKLGMDVESAVENWISFSSERRRLHHTFSLFKTLFFICLLYLYDRE